MTMPASRPARRELLLSVAVASLFAACSKVSAAADTESAFASSPFRKLTPADWQRRLPAASFGVLRNEDTEAPFSNPLNNEHRKGTFVCLGCELPLFRSEWKFDSHTGWPSFFRAIDSNVGHKNDLRIGVPRTEYHCARCLGHQGHVFDDGPRPTGLRYCNNGEALKFIPA